MRRPSRVLFWCNVAAVVMLFIGIAVVLGTVLWTGDLLPPSPLGSLTIIVTLAIPLGFIFLVLPLVEARRETFTERRTPRVQRNSIVMALWLPCAVFPVSLGVTIWLTGQDQLADAQLLEADFLGWWMVGFVTAVAYGIGYTYLVVCEVQSAARRAGVCCHCGYRLAEIPNCQRCPECGTEVGPRRTQAGGTS